MFSAIRRWNNRCPSESDLRQAVDQGLDASPIVARHLQSCFECHERFQGMAHDASVSQQAMEYLEPDSPTDVDSWQAFDRLLAVAKSKDISLESRGNFMQQFWARRGVRTAAGLVAVIAIVMVLAISPVGSAAGNLMDRFRVQKFAAITVSEDDFLEFGLGMALRVGTSDIQSLEEAVSDLGTVDTTFNRDDLFANVQEFDDASQAEAAYGPFQMPGDVPDGFEDPRYYVSDAGTVTATINTANLQSLIDELNLPIYEIPDAGAYPELVFTVEVPQGLVLHYPLNNAPAGDDHEDGLFVAQMESPTLITPDGINMDRMREDILRLPGLPPDFVAQLRAIQDWEETLIIPVPEGATSKDVTVQGQPGLLIETDEAESAVIWEKDGTLFIVGGTVSGDDALDIAGSLS